MDNQEIEGWIKNNIGLIKKIVKKFKPKDCYEWDEMIQAGRIGIYKAAKTYDPSKGAVTTYIYRSIFWSIYSYLRQKKRENREIVARSRNDSDDVLLDDYIPIGLDQHEETIVLLIVRGYKAPEISKELDLALSTTKKYIKQVREKLNRERIKW